MEDLRARLSETEGRCLLVHGSVLSACTLLLFDICGTGFTIDSIHLMLNLNTACNVTERLERHVSDGDSRVRDSEEATISKIRETQRKAKLEAEEEAKDAIKVFTLI